MTESTALQALSPLDGRYFQQTRELSGYFCEQALIRNRVVAEIEYLIAFCKATKVASLSTEQTTKLRGIFAPFSLSDAALVKAHEAKCHHDVKAVEYFLRDRFTVLGLTNLMPYIHFGLTSEDTNFMAYGLALNESRDKVILPALSQIIDSLRKFVKINANTVMLARTHGQPAVPTTLGKEFAVFLSRLLPEFAFAQTAVFAAKVSGAVGTFAAQSVAFPEVDWPEFSDELIAKLGLRADPVSTQVVSAESYTRYFQSLSRINSILLDCVQDSWRYISDGWLVQDLRSNEVGSSTMPQKINPIDFENAEGNFGLANALLGHMCEKLPISRLQRDLSDSTLKRSIGVALGHSVLGWNSLARGLAKISPNAPAMLQALEAHPEIISEGLQTLLRADGVGEAYEIFKEATRGKCSLTLEELKAIGIKHAKTTETKQKIASLTLESYTGLAAQLAQQKGHYASSRQ